MYCVNCGVRLADTESVCPLCQTRVYHPDLKQSPAEPLYPKTMRSPQRVVKPRVLEVFATVLFLIPMLITMISDLKLNSSFTWSLYVIGALAMSYVIFILPLWFSKPNPVIFTPVSLAAITLYLLLVDLLMGSGWFLGFAFPIMGALTLIITADVALFRYVRRGWIYTVGGTIIAFGAFCVLLEFLIILNFGSPFVAWSAYPLVACLLFGGLCIFIAIYRPARELMERKFFF